MKRSIVAVMIVASMLMACACSKDDSDSTKKTEADVEVTDVEPEDSETEVTGRRGIKYDQEYAEYQIDVAMQQLLIEMYGDSVYDARVNVEKIYTAEEEAEDPMLSEYGLTDDQVAFELRYELYPNEGVDPMTLCGSNGYYDEESGWVMGCYLCGILSPVEMTEESIAEYEISSYGTCF